MKTMEIRPIRTKQDYKAALKAVSPFFDSEPERGTPEADYFQMLATLIEAFERKHYPIAQPDPIEAVKFRMAQQGLTAKDLRSMIGKPELRLRGSG
jgi:HTH-type transcriptional regulator / antitoxin HigA